MVHYWYINTWYISVHPLAQTPGRGNGYHLTQSNTKCNGWNESEAKSKYLDYCYLQQCWGSLKTHHWIDWSILLYKSWLCPQELVHTLPPGLPTTQLMIPSSTAWQYLTIQQESGTASPVTFFQSVQSSTPQHLNSFCTRSQVFVTPSWPSEP